MKDEDSLGSLQTAPEMVCQTVVPLKINKESGGGASFIGKKRQKQSRAKDRLWIFTRAHPTGFCLEMTATEHRSGERKLRQQQGRDYLLSIYYYKHLPSAYKVPNTVYLISFPFPATQ